MDDVMTSSIIYRGTKLKITTSRAAGPSSRQWLHEIKIELAVVMKLLLLVSKRSVTSSVCHLIKTNFFPSANKINYRVHLRSPPFLVSAPWWPSSRDRRGTPHCCEQRLRPLFPPNNSRHARAPPMRLQHSTYLMIFVFALMRKISGSSAICVTLPFAFSKSSWYLTCNNRNGL